VPLQIPTDFRRWATVGGGQSLQNLLQRDSSASAVDRACASGLVSSLVISLVVKLTFSLRRLRLAGAACVAGDSRCIVCILIMVMMLWGHTWGRWPHR
jgi:hypothetical protein